MQAKTGDRPGARAEGTAVPFNVSGVADDRAAPQPQGESDASGAPSPRESVNHLLLLIGEYKEYAAYYLSARIDGLKSSLRNAGIFAALGLLLLITGCAILSTAVVLLLVGASLGLAHLLGTPPRYWLGALVVGAGVLLITALVIWLMVQKLKSSFRKSTVDKYEKRQQWQRGQFGRSVEQTAAQAEQSE